MMILQLPSMWGYIEIIEPLSKEKIFLFNVRCSYWDKSHLVCKCADNIIRRCVLESLMNKILEECQVSPMGGHHGGVCIVSKVLQRGYCFPSLHHDEYVFVKACPQY